MISRCRGNSRCSNIFRISSKLCNRGWLRIRKGYSTRKKKLRSRSKLSRSNRNRGIRVISK